jgi:hypothetical protein
VPGDNCFIRECFSELHHSTEVFVFEPPAKLAHQLSRQRGDNLLSVGCSFVPQDLPQDSVTNLPIERSESDIDGCRRPSASIFNQNPGLVQEISGATRFHFQLRFAIPILYYADLPYQRFAY